MEFLCFVAAVLSVLRVRHMRITLAVFVLLVGCVIPSDRVNGSIEIENALEKRVTVSEARTIALDFCHDDRERERVLARLDRFFLDSSR
jgi:hypothetical protein